jgi:hypothetical protein
LASHPSSPDGDKKSKGRAGEVKNKSAIIIHPAKPLPAISVYPSGK